MSASYGEPPDPVYVAFRDGVLKANDDTTDASRWRWSPRHKGWFTYSVEKWILDDVAVADTPPGYSFDLIKDDDPDVERARASSVLPPLFREVQAAYGRHHARWPNLVWSWRGGGDWRNALARTDPLNPDPRPDAKPDPGDVIDRLTPECKQRVADVRAFAKRGDITAAQAQRLIAKIVEDCVVKPV
jgi:hypothetical protein